MSQATAEIVGMARLRASQPMRPRSDVDHSAELLERYLRMYSFEPDPDTIIPSVETISAETGLSLTYVEIGLESLCAHCIVTKNGTQLVYAGATGEPDYSCWTSWGMFNARRRVMLDRMARKYHACSRSLFTALKRIDVPHHLTLELELATVLSEEMGSPCVLRMMRDVCHRDPIFSSVFDPFDPATEKALDKWRRRLLTGLSKKSLSVAAAVNLLDEYYGMVERVYFIENPEFWEAPFTRRAPLGDSWKERARPCKSAPAPVG